jgi:hypothetical protein
LARPVHARHEHDCTQGAGMAKPQRIENQVSRPTSHRCQPHDSGLGGCAGEGLYKGFVWEGLSFGLRI